MRYKLNFKNSIFFLFYIVILLGIKGCASISSPMGGPKDEMPPKLLLSSPTKNATNFNGKTIELVFDEHIAVNNLSQQLLISPYTENKFTHKIKKKRLTLTFEKNFLPNTTVQLNFREGIKDLTEGNVYSNLKMAFSTGNFLDSLSISGQVTDWLTKAPAAQVSVQLYDVNDTNSITNGKPLYLTKTDKAGNYQLENLKEGTYMLFALADNNQNLKHDSKELVGFIPDTIQLVNSEDTNDVIYDIALFYGSDKEPLLQKAATQKGITTLQFSKGLTDLSITALSDSTQNYFYKWEKKEERSKAIIYNQFQEKDTTFLLVQMVDSVGNKGKDTAKVFFATIDSVENASRKKQELIRTPSNLLIPADQQITWTFPAPFLILNDTILYILIDSTKREVITRKELKIDNNQLEIAITLPACDKHLIIYFLENNFLTLQGDTFPAKTDSLVFTKPKVEDFGTISGTVDSVAGSFVVELLSSDLKTVVQTIRNQRKFIFQLIPPGTYRLRLIEDKNNNGRWDTGRLSPFLQLPENIYLLSAPIQLKANWELEGFKF